MNKEQIRNIMVSLTIIDLILLGVFILVLSSNPQYSDSNKNVNNAVADGTDDEKESVSSSEINIVGEKVEIPMEDDYSSKDDLRLQVYEDKLYGSHIASNNMVYNFMIGNKYSGFFDSADTNITGGMYKLYMKDDVPVLHIYRNPSSSLHVEYSLSLNAAQNLVLYYKPASSYIELK